MTVVFVRLTVGVRVCLGEDGVQGSELWMFKWFEV